MIGDRFEERRAVGLAVLEAAGLRVARSDQDIQPGLDRGGSLDERLQRIGAEVRADGEGIGRHGGRVGVGAGEQPGGVRFGGRSDVAAFGVEQHDQPHLAGMPHHPGQGGDSVGALRLEERRLRFDSRHQIGDRVDHAAAEGLVGRCSRFRRRPDAVGQQFFPRIQPDQGGGAGPADRGVQPGDVRHARVIPGGPRRRLQRGRVPVRLVRCLTLPNRPPPNCCLSSATMSRTTR